MLYETQASFYPLKNYLLPTPSVITVESFVPQMQLQFLGLRGPDFLIPGQYFFVSILVFLMESAFFVSFTLHHQVVIIFFCRGITGND